VSFARPNYQTQTCTTLPNSATVSVLTIKPWFYTNILDSLGLLQQAGNEPALNALLRVYKNYYPDIIVGPGGQTRSSSLTVDMWFLIIFPVLISVAV
jgi:hypothetical protein